MISIVMSYLDRRPQLLRTLKSIHASEYQDFEIICVDDGSVDEHKIKDLEADYPKLKVVEIDQAAKDWTDTAIPWNIGFSHVSPEADIIIVQNAECLHATDILSHAVANVSDRKYIAYSTYALTEPSTAQLDVGGTESAYPLANDQFFDGKDGWYNHRTHRPVAYCFCAAITHNTLKQLGGFDERFSYGCGKGDREIIDRLKRMRVAILISEDTDHVFHQFHEQNPHGWNRPESMPLKLKNSALYAKTQRETLVKAPANRYYNG